MKRTRGFTLIELAIVLVIVTILIGGLAMPLSAQIQARRIAETRADMQAIHDTLIGYAMSHYITPPSTPCTCNYDLNGDFDTTSSCIETRLCPATSAPSTSFTPTRHHLPCPDTSNDGIEGLRSSATGDCEQTRGGLPWITLGVKGQDAWGNRYTYAITPEFGNNKIGFTSMSPAPPATPPTNPSAGKLNIYPNNTCGTPSAAKDVPVIVVSHGPNGRGARNVNFISGTPTPAPPSDTSKDELQNLNRLESLLPCGNNTQFVRANPSDAFDDLLMWVSSNELFNRVCPAGGCP